MRERVGVRVHVGSAMNETRVDAQVADALARDLHGAIRGDVRFDKLTRTIYSTDASLYEIHPAGVVMPRDADDVVATVNLCRKHGVPIVARGAGTGIAGGALGWGVQLDFSRYMHAIGAIDATSRTVIVEPGVVLDDLNAVAGKLGLSFPADVATASRATIGGMIANNSCGAHSVYYGRTVDYVESLTVVLADGSVSTWRQLPYRDLPASKTEGQRDKGTEGQSSENATSSQRCIEAALDRIRQTYHSDVLERYPRVLRRNGGYALDRLCMSDAVNPATLLCGSEGTLGLVVSATLRLVHAPKHRALAVLQFDSVLDAVGATPQLLEHRPAAVELVDDLILRPGIPLVSSAVSRQLFDACPKAILVCELYDDEADSLRARMTALENDVRQSRLARETRIVFDPTVQLAVWMIRNKGFGLLMSKPGDRHPHEFIEDAAVDPARLRDYIADLGAILRDEGVHDVAYYAHASVGVIHVRPTLNLKRTDDVARMRRIADKTVDLVMKYGGAMTGEHGDGIVRSEWLERLYGPRIVQAFREVKRAFDPDNLFNPRKIVDPLPMDERIRYASHPRTVKLDTYFDYSAHGSMQGLANMCSGVGQCRQKLVGTMCPSYMATLDEKHTTRARALALRSALTQGGLLNGLDDPALDEVMDLCLSCKACKTECPTGVDMARMKSEWLAHRNAAHGVSMSARFLAAAPQLAALGSAFPRISNWLIQSPLGRGMMERLFGVDRRVAPPAFAQQTFRQWFDTRGGAMPTAVASACRPLGTVVYFADTWTNYYWPQVGIAAVRLLEAAGYEVVAPQLACCGRPAISKGMLDLAVANAKANVEALLPYVDAGAWIVGSEPSCILTFIDEVPHFVRTESAKRIATRVRTVEQLLAQTLEADPTALPWNLSVSPQKVLLHGHCHQKALIGTADALRLLCAIPHCEAAEINSGCCGMAGSFGHEHEHYDVSAAIGELRLFPMVRNRGNATIAVSGFSCREQVAHHANAAARHVLEIAAQAIT